MLADNIPDDGDPVNLSKADKLASKAQENAEHTGTPFVVTWNDGSMFLVPAYNYNAGKHGCVERIRYPEKYKYPHGADAVLQGEDMW